MLRHVVALLLSMTTASSLELLPNGYAWGCLNISKDLPFCNSKLGWDARLDDLVGRLTVDEIIGLVAPYIGSGVNPCGCMDRGVLRLGIPEYMHLVEMNSAAASACYGMDKCSTNFPGPTGLAASFNRTMWRLKGAAISDEFRAFNNLNWHRGTPDQPLPLIGLTGFGPNINMLRDPRWGRNSEVPSEDPFLTGTYAEHYLNGGQVGEDKRYTKVAMGLKHFAAYSVENNRFSFIPNITQHDLWETYFPGYRLGFEPDHGNASLTMCSYAGVNGVPSCANGYFFNQVVRKNFSNPDVVVTSDCMAFWTILNGNKYAKNVTDLTRKTLFAGTDIEASDDFWGPTSDGGQGGLKLLLAEDPSALSTLKQSVKRVLKIRFKTGLFDPIEGQIYMQIGAEAINSSSHQELNRESARQSFVLLKNDGGLLPVKPNMTIAVIGPHIDSQRDLMSDYTTDAVCLGGTHSCVPTIGRIFEQRYQWNSTFAKGCDLNSTNVTGIPAAVAAARQSDISILFLGIGNNQEREGLDRTEVGLPGEQHNLFNQVHAVGKPVVVVLINGGQVSIGSIKNNAHAIVEAFYPSTQGADALFDVLINGMNEFGKMPYTVMPEEDVYQLEMTSFDMATYPGRTYKYYLNAPEWEFGYGLSYTKFHLECGLPTPGVILHNTGEVAGTEVVQIYHRVSYEIKQAAPHPVPTKELFDFTRLSLSPGETEEVMFTVPETAFQLVDETGHKKLYPGTHYLDITNGVQTCTYEYVK